MTTRTPTIQAPEISDPLIADAYEQAAAKSVLAALNPKVFDGFWSVCADGIGHGPDNTFPGLDWGQQAEALLWLGREREVLLNWNYVRSFQRDDGMLPIAIVPSIAGRERVEGYPGRYLHPGPRGELYDHWVDNNPFRALPNCTLLQVAHAIVHHGAGDRTWLADQLPVLRKAAQYLFGLVDPRGIVIANGYYMERPARVNADGIDQCYTAHSLRLAAELLELAGDVDWQLRCTTTANRIAAAFDAHFWAGDRCVEYIHPTRGPIATHGFTDVDWAAIATGLLRPRRVRELWTCIRDNPDFLYDGIPTGVVTNPLAIEDWECQGIDRHDLAAMGRIWYLETWARHMMGDRDGLIESIRRVARAGQRNDWYWDERYYSERTGNGGAGRIEKYVEYPANLIRVVNQFLLKNKKEPPHADATRTRVPSGHRVSNVP